MGNKLKEIRKQQEKAGYVTAPQKSIGQQLLGNSWVGRLLYGKPETYTDGYGAERKDADFKESANGQLVQRMKETATSAGRTVADNLLDVPMDIYSGIESGIKGDWTGVGLAAASVVLPQALETGVKQVVKNSNLIEEIKDAANNVPLSFETLGRSARANMEMIPGNKSIVDQLSDHELGYLLEMRSRQMNNVPKQTRIAILSGDVDNFSNIDIMNGSEKIGYLLPEYKDVVPGTVSVHWVENLKDGVEKGVSESAYNALMIATEKPMSANRIWRSPEKTNKIYNRFQQLPPDPKYTTVEEWSVSSSNNSLTKGKTKLSAVEEKYMDERLKRDGYSDYYDEYHDVDGNVVGGNDDAEELSTFYITKPRPILAKPNAHIPTKHKMLFKINNQSVQNGKPIVRWDLPDIWMKQGGILKSQPGTKLLVPHKDYLGTPYKQNGDYDYFSAHPSNQPVESGEHWTSRNPVTGQLLKSENHPTFDLMVESENKANMNIYHGLNGSLYSYPKNQHVPLYLKHFNYGSNK